MRTVEGRLVSIFIIVFFTASGIFFWSSGLPWNFHGHLGIAAFLFSILHVVMNRKMLSGMAKAFKAGKLPLRGKLMFISTILLIIAWWTASISGIMRLLALLFLNQVYPYGYDEIYWLGAIIFLHGPAIFATILLIIFHLCLHIPHIKNAFKKKTPLKEVK